MKLYPSYPILSMTALQILVQKQYEIYINLHLA